MTPFSQKEVVKKCKKLSKLSFIFRIFKNLETDEDFPLTKFYL